VSLRQRLHRLLFPIATVVIAFVLGGLVVILVGANPFTVYKQLAVGAGLDWPFQYLPGHPVHVDPVVSEINLTHTLAYATPLVLTGLAVGFAFRCGLFNIGGQGQYWVGAYLAVEVALYVSDHWPGHGREAVFLATVAAALMGSAWAAIAGFLKAYRGAHEVISTIMLNWIAIFGGQWLFGLGGPLQDKASSAPVSRTLPPSATYNSIWGFIPGSSVTIAIFIALGAAVVYSLILSRTTLGYEVRAVGFNSEAARYGRVSVKRSSVLAVASAGGFAGLAGAADVMGSGSFQIQTTNLQVVDAGFTGIAVALLGRNTGIGIVLGGLLFAVLHTGANNISSGLSPELAINLATIIQGVIILFVGGEVAVRWFLSLGGRGRRKNEPPALTLPAPTAETPV
jgi:general nucleoside transport system permease protein